MSLKIKTTAYNDATVAAFPGVFREIVNAIIANPTVFTPLPITEVQLQDAVTAMENTTDAANRGGETEKTARQYQHEICVGYLDQLAAFVLQIASMKPNLQQQIEVVQLSKFTLQKITHEPTSPLPQVSNVSGKWTGATGQALIEWDRIREGAHSYNVYISLTAPGPETAWEFKGSTTRKKLMLNGLPNIGTQVWVQVVAVGKDNETSVPSVPVEVSVEPVN